MFKVEVNFIILINQINKNIYGISGHNLSVEIKIIADTLLPQSDLNILPLICASCRG